MKVLIIRFSSIGDIVLTSPVVRCVKEQLPNAQVHYLTKQSFASVVEHNPHIDKCIYLQESFNATIDLLKIERYDYVIDLHNNIRTLKVKKALGAIAFSFPKLNFRKWLYVNFKWNLMPDRSIVERYFEAVNTLGVKNDGQGLDYFISKDDEVTSEDIPMSHWNGYIACVIGGSYATKKYPIEKWMELCKKTLYPIILLGGPEDKEAGDKIAEVDNVKVYNASGKFSLNESACLVKFSKLVVTNDTGLMHIAAAYKKSVISLWGNTTPFLGMFPYYGYNNVNKNISRKSNIIEVAELGCRPCSKIGYGKCPKGHFKCMQMVDNQLLIREVEKIWHSAQP